MLKQQAHTIEVEITSEGEIKATVKGISGSQCVELSAFLDELGDVVEDQRTPDYYRQQAVSQGHRLRAGQG